MLNFLKPEISVPHKKAPERQLVSIMVTAPWNLGKVAQLYRRSNTYPIFTSLGKTIVRVKKAAFCIYFSQLHLNKSLFSASRRMRYENHDGESSAILTFMDVL